MTQWDTVGNTVKIAIDKTQSTVGTKENNSYKLPLIHPYLITLIDNISQFINRKLVTFHRISKFVVTATFCIIFNSSLIMSQWNYWKSEFVKKKDFKQWWKSYLFLPYIFILYTFFKCIIWHILFPQRLLGLEFTIFLRQ